MAYQAAWTYDEPQVQKKKNWDPVPLLEIIDDHHGFTCVGYAPSKGRRCHNRTREASRQQFLSKLNQLSYLHPRDDAVASGLKSVAGTVLCYLHVGQIENVVAEWLDAIRMSYPKRPISKPAKVKAETDEKEKAYQEVREFLRRMREEFDIEESDLKDRIREQLRREEETRKQEEEKRKKAEEALKKQKEEEEALKRAAEEALKRDFEEVRKMFVEEEKRRQAEAEEKKRQEEEEAQEKKRQAEEEEQKEIRRKAEEQRREEAKRQAEKERQERKEAEERRQKEAEEAEQRRQKAQQERERREREQRQKAEREKPNWEALWTDYEQRWASFKQQLPPTNQKLSDAIPWPVKSGLFKDVVAHNVKEFMQNAVPAGLRRKEMLKWHQDRLRYLPRSGELTQAERMVMEMICRVGTDLLNAASGRASGLKD